MPDEKPAQEAGQGQEPKPTAEPEPKASGFDSLPAETQAEIRKLREEAAGNRKRAQEAEAKVTEFQDRDKSEQQKAKEKAEKAESEAQKASLRALRYEVAAAKDLPLKWAARLSGSSKEELEKDADVLAKELKPESRTTADGGVRQTVPDGGMDAYIRRAAGRA